MLLVRVALFTTLNVCNHATVYAAAAFDIIYYTGHCSMHIAYIRIPCILLCAMSYLYCTVLF